MKAFDQTSHELRRFGNLVPEGLGTTLAPRKAVAALTVAVRHGLNPTCFGESIRVEAMLMSAPKALASYASALKCWGAFADGFLLARGKHLPPTVHGLISWSKIFVNKDTFGNYVTAVRKGCLIANVPF